MFGITTAISFIVPYTPMAVCYFMLFNDFLRLPSLIYSFAGTQAQWIIEKMADVSLDEVIRQRGINLKPAVKR